VQVNGQIEGDLNCPSLIVSPGAKIKGAVTAEQVEVNGTVEGPIHGGDVVRINDQWRVCFRFAEGDAFDVEITD